MPRRHVCSNLCSPANQRIAGSGGQRTGTGPENQTIRAHSVPSTALLTHHLHTQDRSKRSWNRDSDSPTSCSGVNNKPHILPSSKTRPRHLPLHFPRRSSNEPTVLFISSETDPIQDRDRHLPSLRTLLQARGCNSLAPIRCTGQYD